MSVDSARGSHVVGQAATRQTPTAAASAAAPLLKSLKYGLLGTLMPLAFVAIWWAAVAAGFFPRSVLPSPFAVGAAMLSLGVSLCGIIGRVGWSNGLVGMSGSVVETKRVALA